jgi:glycosyltransferase EpsH
VEELISVIVPVYNVEKYLPTCLNSILNQTFKNFELILVDDGSTDRSLEIIEEYARKDNRISVIKQKNQYAGVARNNGLAIAKGKYVMFLDSDDFFAPNMLKCLYKTAEKYNAQIVECGSYRFDDKTKQVFKGYGFLKKISIKSSKTLGENVLNTASSVPWDKLILKSFLLKSGIKYQEIECYNDEYFNRMIVAVAEKIIFIRKRLIYYRVNNPKSLQGNKQKNLLCLVLTLVDLKHNLELRKIYNGKVKKSYLKHALRNAVNSIMRDGSSESRKTTYEYIKRNAIPMIIDNIDEAKQNEEFYLLLTSVNYEDFLEKEMLYMKQEYIPKESRKYKIAQLVTVQYYKIFRNSSFFLKIETKLRGINLEKM